jgi:hypothetical protein
VRGLAELHGVSGYDQGLTWQYNCVSGGCSAHMPLPVCIAGAQALVAWSLQQSFPDVPLQMVAEEDSADLRSGTRWHDGIPSK